MPLWAKDVPDVHIPFLKGDTFFYDKEGISGAFSASGNLYRYETAEIGPYHSVWEHLHEFSLRQRYWRVKPCEIVIDVGSCLGSYTLSALADGARVFSFEPDQALFESLKRSVALNKGFGARSRLFQKKAQEFDFSRIRPDRIKIDVEGEEVEVVKAMLETIQKNKPMVLIEVHLSKKVDVREISAIVKPRRVTRIIEEGTFPDTEHNIIEF